MSNIADKIYAATGLTLGAEEAAKIGQMIQQARRDALEEAARVAENCDHPWVEAREAEHEAAALMAGTIAAAIRALGEKE